MLIGFFYFMDAGKQSFNLCGLWNTLQRANTLEENRRVEPCKVDKSNGIEIQINAALNDAYRISLPWKERKCEGKDPVMSRRRSVGKNAKKTMDNVCRIWSGRFYVMLSSILKFFLQTLTWYWGNFVCDISLETIKKFDWLNRYERHHKFYFKYFMIYEVWKTWIIHIKSEYKW